MKKIKSKEFVYNQIPVNIAYKGVYYIDAGDFSVSTIRKAINYFGLRCAIRDGNIFAVVDFS